MRFIAFIGTVQESERENLRRARKYSLEKFECVLDCASLEVWCERGQGERVHPLTRGRGVILGQVFARDVAEGAPVRAIRLDDRQSDQILASQGRALVKEYWGHYVALLETQDTGALVLRDPTGGIPCYCWRGEAVTVVCSHFSDLSAVPGFTVAINWRHLLASIYARPMHTRETSVVGVTLLAPAECARFDRRTGDMRLESYWDPVAIAESDPIEDFNEATQRASCIVRSCIRAWAENTDEVTLLFSGGLDSCVVLFSLLSGEAPSGITAMCFFEPPVSQEHKRYLERVSRRLQERYPDRVSLVHCQYPPQEVISIEELEKTGPFASPAFYCWRRVRPNVALAHARQRGGVLMDGLFGDEIFFASQTHIANDYVWRHELGRDLLRTARAAGRSEHRHWRETLREAIRIGLLKPAHICSYVLDPDTFVRSDVYEAFKPEAERYLVSPFLRTGAPSIPPGERKHVSVMANFTRPPCVYDLDEHTLHVSPIASQPICELFLRMPTYVLTSGGVNRAVVRRAFAADLDEEHLRPGALSLEYYMMSNPIGKMIGAERSVFRELLMEGELVRQGVLDREKLSLYFERLGQTWSDLRDTDMMHSIDAEIWLRSMHAVRPA
ncbi:MAG: hypothetical protein WDO68_22870 [Gammaproteobacteria bacterium]